MATLNEITYSIKNQLSGYVITDDNRLDDAFIQHEIKQYRSTLIKEMYRDTKRLDSALYQFCYCLKVTCDTVICDGNVAEAKIDYVEVPPLEGSIGWENVKYFGSLDDATPYYRRTYEGLTYSSDGQYTANMPQYSVIGGKAYFTKLVSPSVKYMKMLAILEDPLKCRKEGCSSITPDDPYPVPSAMLAKLEMLVMKQISQGLSIPPDVKNDAEGVVYQEQPVKRE
jgi:hypothetical protein|tara:strand:+ start:987 stop:1664 length:678 start_codon:yes stop_codon:yes gene_type:complete